MFLKILQVFRLTSEKKSNFQWKCGRGFDVFLYDDSLQFRKNLVIIYGKKVLLISCVWDCSSDCQLYEN